MPTGVKSQQMTKSQEYEILEDAEVVSIQNQLRAAGAPVDDFTKWALNEATTGMNPGVAVATRIVADCLLQKLKEWQEQRKPKTFLGRLIQWLFTSKKP